MAEGVERVDAKARGVQVSEWKKSSLSWYSQVKGTVGEGGWPRRRVRIRWISRIMDSLAEERDDEEEEEEDLARERSSRAYSRSLAVMMWSIVELFLALKLSGKRACGTSPYFRTKFCRLTLSGYASCDYNDWRRRGRRRSTYRNHIPLSSITNRCIQ